MMHRVKERCVWIAHVEDQRAMVNQQHAALRIQNDGGCPYLLPESSLDWDHASVMRTVKRPVGRVSLGEIWTSASCAAVTSAALSSARECVVARATTRMAAACAASMPGGVLDNYASLRRNIEFGGG
jgi:hypothetical protein